MATAFRSWTRIASLQSIRLQSRLLSRTPIAPLHTTVRNMASSDDWKHRAPYRIHKEDDTFHARYEGSCHCGRVTYQLSREAPLDAKYCHCTTCQTLHGQSIARMPICGDPLLKQITAAPFQWAAIFHKDDINFTNGHHDLVWYDSSEKTTKHKLPCKITCSYCRSPIMDEGRNMILLYPTLIHFKGNEEDKKKFAPT